MANEPVRVPCPFCHGQAKQVPASVFYPKDRGAVYRKVWACAPCRAFAEMDRDTEKPVEGLANLSLHQARQLVAERLLESTITPVEFREEMDMKPWACKISHFNQQQCTDALHVLNSWEDDQAEELLA